MVLRVFALSSCYCVSSDSDPACNYSCPSVCVRILLMLICVLILDLSKPTDSRRRLGRSSSSSISAKSARRVAEESCICSAVTCDNANSSGLCLTKLRLSRALPDYIAEESCICSAVNCDNEQTHTHVHSGRRMRIFSSKRLQYVLLCSAVSCEHERAHTCIRWHQDTYV